MRSRPGQFAAVGLAATIIDIGVLVIGRLVLGWPVLVADAVAVAVAAGFSVWTRRALASPEDPYSRAADNAAVLVALAVATGAIDVVILRALAAAFGSQVDTVTALLAAKAPALSMAAVARLAVYRRVLFSRIRADLFRSSPRPPPPGDFRLSVVVPAYREESRIGDTIIHLRQALASVGSLEIVVVDDGSGDGTSQAASRAGADRVITLDPNRGKGGAVRAGILAARGRTIAFTDADLAYPPAQLGDLLTRVEEGFDFVTGSRRHVETTTLVKARRLREVSGRLFNLWTTLVLLGQYRDTQCGMKAFRADAARQIFERTRLDGFAFDVEVFHLAERLRLTVSEVPVELANTATSSVQVGRDALRMMRDLLRVRWWATTGRYDRATPAPPPAPLGSPGP